VVKFWKIFLSVCAVALIVVLALMFTNYLPNPIFPYQTPEPKPEQSPTIETVLLDKAESLNLFEQSVGQSIPLTEEQINNLNIKIYGLLNTGVSEVITWYKEKLYSDSWSVFEEMSDSDEDWEYEGVSFVKGLMGQLVIVCGGEFISYHSDYELILITSSAPVTTYYEIYDQIGDEL